MNLTGTTTKDERIRWTGDAAKHGRFSKLSNGSQAEPKHISFICFVCHSADELILTHTERMPEKSINSLFQLNKSGHAGLCRLHSAPSFINLARRSRFSRCSSIRR